MRTGVNELVIENRARMSMVDGFPYKEEVGGSSPSAPTRTKMLDSRCWQPGSDSIHFQHLTSSI